VNHQNLSSFIWSVADLLRGDYKQSDYGKVILPFTVLRRLDCVLERTKAKVLAEYAAKRKAGLNPDPFPRPSGMTRRRSRSPTQRSMASPPRSSPKTSPAPSVSPTDFTLASFTSMTRLCCMGSMGPLAASVSLATASVTVR